MCLIHVNVHVHIFQISKSVGAQSWAMTTGETCQRPCQVGSVTRGTTWAIGPAEIVPETPDRERPWCFTNITFDVWEYCDIPFCKRESNNTEYFSENIDQPTKH